MVKKKTLKTMYRVPKNDLLSDGMFGTIYGIRCTDNMAVRHMTMKDAAKHSIPIEGHIIDESLRECLIFTFFDSTNYSVKEDTFVEITYEDLIEECKPIEIVVNE